MKVLYPLFSIFFALLFNLHSEVDKVILTWDAALCLDQCTLPLEKNLRGIEGVKAIQINAKSGNAVIDWAPNTPFSFGPFNTATRFTGIRLSDIRVRVRGTVSQQGSDFYLTSVGDNTRFLLVGPLKYEPEHYLIKEATASHPIEGNLRTQMQTAVGNNSVVTVEGPLFEPYRMYLAIIVQQFKLPPPSEQANRPYLERKSEYGY